MNAAHESAPVGGRAQGLGGGGALATIKDITIRTAALELAAHGWPVHPRIGRRPLLRHGHLDASTDPNVVAAMPWERATAIGCRMPAAYVAIDIDPRHGGSLEVLTALVGPLPETVTVISGRGDGGRHLYFDRPYGPLSGSRLPAGFDFLEHNGTLPPSRHPDTGGVYRWGPVAVVAPMPPRLRELLRPIPPPPRPQYHYRGDTSHADAGLIRTVSSAPERQRNQVLFWASNRAAERGRLDDLADELRAAARSAGLSDNEIRRTLASAAKTGGRR